MAMVIAAGIILYIAFDTPEFRAVPPPTANAATTATAPPQNTLVFDNMPTQLDTQASTDATDYTDAFIPTDGAQTPPPATTRAAAKPAQPVFPININTATKEQLMALNGIGEKRAEAIVADRRENGPFRSVEDITRVKGIGDGILANIRNNITV